MGRGEGPTTPMDFGQVSVNIFLMENLAHTITRGGVVLVAQRHT
jgi:hypothetical protein